MHAIMKESSGDGLKSTGNTMTVRKIPPEHRKQLQKFLLNLKGPFTLAIFRAIFVALFNAIIVAPEFAMKIASVI